MFLRLFALVVLSLSQLAYAQPGSPPARARLMESREAERPIQLQSLHVSGEIIGGMAQTTVRMVFFNPNVRQLEGQLQFPLLQGQEITAFSLDIEGSMRPAVPVEKAKGREIFESVERRQVDPGLLESTQGNNFKLRVYPIAARGTRSVELKYVEALARQGGNWLYSLPLAYGDRLKDFELELKVAGGVGAPRATGTLGTVDFRKQAQGYQAHVQRTRFSPTGVLNILVPAARHAQTYVDERDGETYFVAEVPVADKRTARALPKRVGLLWDSSGSGANRSHDAELAELDHYFKALGTAEVRLTRLRDRAEPIMTFHVAGGNWDALRQSLKATVYDGASALADWKPQPDVGEYLMISDGLLNYGPARFPLLSQGQRLYAISSSVSADHGRLAALAERSGGRLVMVLADKPGSAAKALLTEAPHVARIDAVGATDVMVDSSDPRQGLLRVAGKLTQPAARMKITLVEQGAPKELTFAAIAKKSPAHPLVSHLWASLRLRALEADFEANRAAIRRLGTQFGIATRETSLIVLDSLQDYVRYDILPPQAYVDDFEQLRSLRSVELAQKRLKHMERIVREFEQKVAWWEKAYPKGEPPPAKGEQQDISSLARTGAVPVPGARAPMAPAPAAMAESAARARAREARAQRTAAPEPAAASPQIGIAIKKWSPDAAYITRMGQASADSLYQVYLDEKPSYPNSTAFFLDAADMLFDKGQRDLALRVLSNLAEMDLENRHVLRILGYRLLQAGSPELAIPVFQKVQLLGEEEPQSFRDLGLAHAAAGNPQKAIDQLWEVVRRPWDDRFSEIELIALAEMNAIIATAALRLDTSRIDPRLLKNLPLDLRVVLTWDADNSDMDLWVTDPNGEKCYYRHQFTYQGGRMSRDFTGGYGPEEFSLREAKPGKYKVEANFYGSRQQVVAGATTLQVKLSSGFGTGLVREQLVTLRLKGSGETVFVGEFEVKAP